MNGGAIKSECPRRREARSTLHPRLARWVRDALRRSSDIVTLDTVRASAGEEDISPLFTPRVHERRFVICVAANWSCGKCTRNKPGPGLLYRTLRGNAKQDGAIKIRALREKARRASDAYLPSCKKAGTRSYRFLSSMPKRNCATNRVLGVRAGAGQGNGVQRSRDARVARDLGVRANRNR
jgi:hypothetical protein